MKMDNAFFNKVRGLLRSFSFLCVVISISFFVLFKYHTRYLPFDWDETDYIHAANIGIFENAFETKSLNIFQFIEIGRSKVNKTSLKNIPDVKESEDVFYLRHFHSPLPEYYWAIFISAGNGAKDIILRYSNIVLMGLLIGLIIFLFFSLNLPEKFPVSIFCLGIPLFITSNIFDAAFGRLNFHVFHLITSLIFVFFLIKYINASSSKNACLLGLGTTFVFISLDTNLFIYAGAFVSVCLLGYLNKFPLRKLLLIFLSFITSLLIFWPGCFRTASPVKAWLMHFYRLVFVHGEEYKDISLFSTLSNFFIENIWIIIFIVSATVLSFIFYRRNNFQKVYFIPLIVGVFYFICMIPFMLRSTYQFPSIGLMVLFAFIVFGVIESQFSFLLKALIALTGLAVSLYPFTQADFKTMDEHSWKERMDFIADINTITGTLKDYPILADGSHIIQFYSELNDEQIIKLELKSQDEPGFNIRENFQYYDVTSNVRNHKYSSIVLKKDKILGRDLSQDLLSWKYRQVILNNYKLFIPLKSESKQ
jgi:hypothetical protein